MGLLDGKTAMITGAARGQGRAHALACAREGADVILTDIAGQLSTVPYKMAEPADLEETTALVKDLGRRVVSVRADVRVQAELDEAVDRGVRDLGQIDILIANAGIWTMTPFWQLSDEQWDEMIAVNLTGVWKSAKAVTPHMIERREGSIVMIASANALEPGVNYAHYVAAKHGVIGLMKNVALELAPYGIRCNSISPGAIRTPMNDHQDSWDLFTGGLRPGTRKDMMEAGFRYGALRAKSFLEPDEVANAALYLNSDLAASVTGVNVSVDAGHALLPGFNHSPVKE
jgi:SDR family mycofactocin-dependent oxidoreductase